MSEPERGWPWYGLHEGVSMEDYHSTRDACSNSRLSDMMRSPAYCYHRMVSDDAPTQTQKLGTAKHFAILEPEKVEETYLVSGTCEAIKGDGARCANMGTKLIGGGWFCGVHSKGLECEVGDRVILTADEWDTVRGVRDAFYANRAAAALMAGQVRKEVSMFWEDERTGLDCKGRPDIMGDGLIADLKNTIDANPSRIDRGIANRGWHRQAAFYLNGLRTLGREVSASLIVAVEPEPPFETCVYALDAEAIRVGAEMVRRLMARYRECLSRGEWPGYPTGVVSASVPLWAAREAFPEEFTNQ